MEPVSASDQLQRHALPFLSLCAIGALALTLWRVGEVAGMSLLLFGFLAGAAYARWVAEAATGRDPMVG
ncbi:MAG: hypothetical protein KTR31_19370 [Myxococcales bacterium]|nr:hypothetical protein [Myxococcales bacterium]